MYTHIEELLEQDYSEIVEKVFTFIDETAMYPEDDKKALNEVFWDEDNIPRTISFELLYSDLDDIEGFEKWLKEHKGTNNYIFDRE